MPLSVDLICVDPKEVHKVWPHVAPLLRKAIERIGLSSFDDLEYDCLYGDGLVWIVWDGTRIRAAVSTILNGDRADKICVLTACSGEGMRDWLPLLAQIETYAKNEGCRGLRIYGRAGWHRILDGYRRKAVVIEKALR